MTLALLGAILLAGVRVAWARVGSLSRGILCGLALGLWANAAFFLLPYLGLYPSWLSIIWSSFLLGRQSGPQLSVAVAVMNMIIYPAIGALLFAMRQRHVTIDACQNCQYDLTGNVSGTCPECGNPTGRDQATSGR